MHFNILCYLYTKNNMKYYFKMYLNLIYDIRKTHVHKLYLLIKNIYFENHN